MELVHIYLIFKNKITISTNFLEFFQFFFLQFFPPGSGSASGSAGGKFIADPDLLDDPGQPHQLLIRLVKDLLLQAHAQCRHFSPLLKLHHLEETRQIYLWPSRAKSNFCSAENKAIYSNAIQGDLLPTWA